MDNTPEDIKKGGKPDPRDLPTPIHSGLYDDDETTRPLNELRSRWETEMDKPVEDDEIEEEEKDKRRRAAALLLGGAGAVGVLGQSGAAGASMLPGNAAGTGVANGGGLAGKIASKGVAGKGTAAAGKGTAAAGKGTAAASQGTGAAAKTTGVAGKGTAAAGKGTGAAAKTTGVAGKGTAAASQGTGAAAKGAGLAGKGAGAASTSTGAASGATSAASGAGTAASGATSAASGAASAASGAASAGAAGAGASTGASAASQGAFAAMRTAVKNSPKAFAGGGAAVAAAAVVVGLALTGGDPTPTELAAQEPQGAETAADAALALIDAVIAEDDEDIAAIIDPDEEPIVSIEGSVVDQVVAVGITIGGSDDSDISVGVPIDGVGNPDINVDVDTPLDSIVDPQIDVDADLDPPVGVPLEGVVGDMSIVDVIVSEEVISADAAIVHVSGNLADASDPEAALEAFDVSIGVVNKDGWFVSLLYTAAETARNGAGLPFDEVGNGPDPVGASSPEAAVGQLLEAASNFETNAVIGSLPPTEMGAIYAYAPLFAEPAQTALQELETDLEFDLEIENLDLSSTETGDVAQVELVDITATVRLGQETATIDTTSDCVVSVSSDAGDVCVIDTEDYDTMVDADIFADVSVVEVDGEWFVSGYPSGLATALSWMINFNDAAFDLEIDPISLISPLIVGGQVPDGFDTEPFLGDTSPIPGVTGDGATIVVSPGVPTTSVGGVDGPGTIVPPSLPITTPTVPGATLVIPSTPLDTSGITIPPIGSLPPITAPPLSLPLTTLAPPTLPPVTAPPVTLPDVTLPPVTLPPVTLPGL